MATIANNHLSQLAQKGRYGDTEIAHTPSGKLWHVNPQEKQLINMYGSEGEKLVDAVGSGTINPETGLEEKFPWVAAAAVVGAGIGLYSAWKSGSSAKDQASHEETAAKSGLEELEGAEENLENAAQAKREAGLLDYRQGVETVSAQTGIAQEDLEEQTPPPPIDQPSSGQPDQTAAKGTGQAAKKGPKPPKPKKTISKSSFKIVLLFHICKLFVALSLCLLILLIINT